MTFRFKDYHQDRKIRVRKLPVLTFIDRLVQHLPEVGFRQVRHYGLFSNIKRTKLLKRARQLLAQRKKRRSKPQTWEQSARQRGTGSLFLARDVAIRWSFGAFYSDHPV